MKMNNIYVIYEDSIWNMEEYVDIVGVTNNYEKAVKIFKDYVIKQKELINYDTLDKDHYENDNQKVTYHFDEYIKNNEEKITAHFSIWENGSYIDNHINITIKREILE